MTRFDVRVDPTSRREFLRQSALGATGLLLGACGGDSTGPPPSGGNARLQVSVTAPRMSIAPGQYEFQVENDGRAILRVPSGAGDRALGLVLLFHGAGGYAIQAIRLLEPYADAEGLVLLAVKSDWITWDAIGGPYGPDLDTIDLSLRYTFDRVRIDASRVHVGGFSDGATYALGVGRGNGDLFRRVLAFSPGYLIATDRVGTPRVFVSHGTQDEVLDIERTSRRIVPELRGQGYQVTYEEFDGPHILPPSVAARAVQWLRG